MYFLNLNNVTLSVILNLDYNLNLTIKTVRRHPMEKRSKQSAKLAIFKKSVRGVLKHLEAIPTFTGEKKKWIMVKYAYFLPAAMQIAQGFYAKDHPRV